MFEVIGTREEGYVLQLQRTCYAGRNQVVMPVGSGDQAVPQEALDHSGVVHEALDHLTSGMFSAPHTHGENDKWYKLKDDELSDLSEVTKCQLDTGILPLEVCEVSSRVVEVLGVRRTQAPIILVMEVDEKGNIVT